MHLDLGGKEVTINLKEESTVRSSLTGLSAERIQVGVVARNDEEHRHFQSFIGKAKRTGINSTDGQGNILNQWKVLNASWAKKKGPDGGYTYLFELEEME